MPRVAFLADGRRCDGTGGIERKQYSNKYIACT